MKTRRFLPAISIVFTTMTLWLPSATGQLSNSSQSSDIRGLIRNYRCQQASQIPLPPSYQQIEFQQSWCGTIPKQLRQASLAKRYITNNLEWVKLWKNYRGDEVIPKINFDRQLVFLYAHFDANAIQMVPARNNKGNLILGISVTELGMGDSPCSYMFSLLDRRGIKTIHGKPIIANTQNHYSGF